MLARILQRWFWDSYDSVWQLGLVNLALFIIGFPIAWFGLTALLAAAGSPILATGLWLLLTVGVLPLYGALWFSATIPFAAEVAEDKDPPLRHIFAGIRGAFVSLWLYLVLCGGIIGVLGVNLWFYARMGWWPVAGLVGWIVLLQAASMLHGIGLAARRGTRPGRTLRVSWSLLFAHPLLTGSVLIVLVGLWILGALCRFVGIMLFGLAGTGTMLNALHTTVQEWQEALARHAAEIPATDREAMLKARTRADADVLAVPIEDTRYRRGFRQILRPWE